MFLGFNDLLHTLIANTLKKLIIISWSFCTSKEFSVYTNLLLVQRFTAPLLSFDMLSNMNNTV